MITIVMATGNQGKIKEMKALLQDVPINLLSMADIDDVPIVEEDGNSFLENAYKKAYSLALHSGMVSMADDSGLEVDCLKGAPGVYSARFAGEHATDEDNNQKLVQLLKDIPIEQRRARFRCCIVLAYPDGRYYSSEGCCEGFIGFEPRGTYGFGYDPIFYLPGRQASMAELSAEQKNAISHRGKAMKDMKKIVIEKLLSNKE